MYVHKTLKLANIPPEYTTGGIVGEVWDARLYDKVIPLEKGMTVFDIGASIGVFSIYASQKVGRSGRVFAFEPESTSYNALVDNIEANNAYNVTPIKMGVWSDCGTQTIEKARGNLGASTMFSDKGEPVQVCGLDEIMPRLGITHVDFVKIDTEGAATEILKGADNSLWNIDNLAIAAYHAKHESVPELRKILEEHCFRTRVMSRFGLDPYIYATKDPTVNLEGVELWQVLTITGIAGLFTYAVMKKWRRNG